MDNTHVSASTCHRDACLPFVKTSPICLSLAEFLDACTHARFIIIDSTLETGSFKAAMPPSGSPVHAKDRSQTG